jgi:hypothetical protein
MPSAHPRPHVLMPAWWLGFAMVALAAFPATDRLAPRVIWAAEAVRKWWNGR